MKRNDVVRTKRVSCVGISAFAFRIDGTGEEGFADISNIVNALRIGVGPSDRWQPRVTAQRRLTSVSRFLMRFVSFSFFPGHEKKENQFDNF